MGTVTIHSHGAAFSWNFSELKSGEHVGLAPTMPIRVDFKILFDQQWVPVDTFLSCSQKLLDYYLNIPDLHCCNFQGGLFIKIDGRSWSDEGTVDEFWMTMSWLNALNEILDGAMIAHASPWEESNLTLRHVDDKLEMEDIHASGHISRPRVRVPIAEFVQHVVREFRKFTHLLAELELAIADKRRITERDDDVEKKLQIVVRNLPMNTAIGVDELYSKLHRSPLLLEEPDPVLTELAGILAKKNNAYYAGLPASALLWKRITPSLDVLEWSAPTMLGALVRQLAPQYFTKESFLNSPGTLRTKRLISTPQRSRWGNGCLKG